MRCARLSLSKTILVNARQRLFVCPMPNWTAEEDQRLRELYLTHEHAEIGVMLGRSRAAVRNRCWRLGLEKGDKPWTEADIATLKEWYGWHKGIGVNLPGIVKHLGRTKFAICLKAQEFGLTDRARQRNPNPHPRRKYFTDKDRYEALSKLRREWYKTHEHPRGATGLRMTDEHKAKLREAIQRRTPEQRSIAAKKAARTRVERYGTGQPKTSNPYSSARRGKREDLGNIFFRSRWEANYARYLNWLKGQGQIKDWVYEAQTFIFHGVTRGAITYLPDFKVIELDGSHKWHEVKGWMKGADRTKLKRMKKYYPDEIVLVIGEAEYRQIEHQVAGLIAKWEYKESKQWANW